MGKVGFTFLLGMVILLSTVREASAQAACSSDRIRQYQSKFRTSECIQAREVPNARRSLLGEKQKQLVDDLKRVEFLRKQEILLRQKMLQAEQQSRMRAARGR